MSRSLALMLTIATIGGCAVDPDDNLGEVNLTLTGQGGSGTVYRLRNAQLTLTGPVGSLAFNTEDDPARTAINARVAAGRYALDLVPGWRIERIPTTGPVETVPATLATPDPLLFDVPAGSVTPVVLRFRVPEGPVVLGEGNVGISIGLDEIPDGGVQTIRTSTTSLVATEGQPITFDLRLDFQPAGLSIVALTSSDPATATVSPATLLFDATNYNVPQTVTVVAQPDPDIDEEPFVITANLPGAASAQVNGKVKDVTPILTFGAANLLGSSISLPQGNVRARQFRIEGRPVTIFRMQLIALTAGQARMAIYRDNGTNAPGQLVAGSTTAPFALEPATPPKNSSIATQVVLEPGLYWQAFTLDRDVTVGAGLSGDNEPRCFRTMAFGDEFPSQFGTVTCSSTQRLNLSALGF